MELRINRVRINHSRPVQIPVFLKPRLLLPLHLYNLRTVPVPFHMNEQEMDSTESNLTYTKLIPSTENTWNELRYQYKFG